MSQVCCRFAEDHADNYRSVATGHVTSAAPVICYGAVWYSENVGLALQHSIS